jgi:hypothetical protein
MQEAHAVLPAQDGAGTPGPSGLLEQLPAIADAFSGSSLPGIYGALQAKGDAWSQDALATLAKCAPPVSPANTVTMLGVACLG